MSGTWTSQNKILPGAYINVRTSEPLSITPGDRGTVALLQELSVGNGGEAYTVTALENNWPKEVTAADKKLVTEALKKAKTVLVYKLPDQHTISDVKTVLAKLKTVEFNTVCYPYDDGAEEIKTAIAEWITSMREEEGIKVNAALANVDADSEGIINVVQGVILSDGTVLTAAETTAWVAGASAGASVTTSNTGMVYTGAIDVSPRMTRLQMESAVQAGKFIFKVDSAQNVTVVSDINSLTTFTPEKGKVMSKNRVIRTVDGIANDVTSIFEGSYVGKINNNEDGRSMLKAALVDYFSTLQNMGAIQNFDTDDVTISAGADSDAVVVDIAVQPVDSIEKIYITVNLA